MTQPPTTSSVTPVTQKELSEARKRVASATSSARPDLSSTFLVAPFFEGRSGRNRARKRGCRVLRKEGHERGLGRFRWPAFPNSNHLSPPLLIAQRLRRVDFRRLAGRQEGCQKRGSVANDDHEQEFSPRHLVLKAQYVLADVVYESSLETQSQGNSDAYPEQGDEGRFD